MTKPYDFQDEDVTKIIRMGGRSLIAWEMGAGKTFASLLFALRTPTARPIIVICPAGLKWNWLHEVNIHTNLRADVLHGMKVNERLVSRNSPITIVNYDILGGWLDYLKSLSPKLVIIDEATYLSGRTTKRCKHVKELCHKIPHVLALSGTPIISRPADLWPILNVIRPDMFPSFYSYAHTHCSPRRTYWGWDFRGASHLDELHKKISEIMVRRRKVDILTDLPKKTRTVIPFDIMGRKDYEEAVGNFLKWISQKHPGKLKSAIKAQQIVQLGYLKRLAATKKMIFVEKWLDDFLAENEEKIIVFCVHKKIIARLHERYEKQSVVVDGSITGNKRKEHTQHFLSDKKCRMLIGNIKAAGVGWSAKGVSHVAFAELGWTPGEHLQGEDRAWGIGRGQKGVMTNIYYLVARNTIESRLVEIIQKKQKTLNRVIDGKKTSVDTLNVFDLLTNELKKERVK
jgi:SWI/SNF-related matrix-associated actin-dependent regulator of chromatin subfamily A-like protein 1